MAVNAVRADEKDAQVSNSKTLGRLLKLLFEYKKYVIPVLVIMGFSIVISLVNPLIIEHAINVNVANQDMQGLFAIVILGVVLNAISFVLVKLRMYLMSVMSNKLVVRLRSDLYIHLQTLGLKFFDSLPAGKILNRIIEDVNSLKEVLSSVVTTLLPQFLTLIAVIVIILVKNWQLALATLITFPILALGLTYIENKCHKLWGIHKKKSSNLSGAIHEDVAGIRITQSFAAEAETRDVFYEMVKEDRDSFRDAVRINDAFFGVINICSALAYVCMYYTAVKYLHFKEVNVGTLVAYASYASMMWQPIQQLGNLYNQIVRNIAGANRIFELLDMEPEVADRPGAIELPDVKGAVDFKNVSFSYDDKKGVLDNVSFHVEPGETIALVGPTGAGKSTIVNLVSRFYDIQQGSITIDGYGLTDVTIESLRAQMGVMTQDNFLFTGTIRENIRYGRLDATDEEVEAAAKSVHAHDFIMKLEKGYDTELKERGAGLSAGERQLIAFARTMLSAPRILILDEATSSIDTKTERLVQDGIASLLQGRTSFVIAHRLSTIKNASRIFVVNDGHIVEAGTHEELLAKKGQYYDLYMAQMA